MQSSGTSNDTNGTSPTVGGDPVRFDTAAYERDVRGIIDAIAALKGNRATSTIEASLRDQLVETFAAAPVTAQAQLLIDLAQSTPRTEQ